MNTSPSDYAQSVAELRKHHLHLADEIVGFGTLESVLGWMAKRQIGLEKIDIIFQDEYSHDFVVPLETEPEHLVFGIT